MTNRDCYVCGKPLRPIYVCDGSRFQIWACNAKDEMPGTGTPLETIKKTSVSEGTGAEGEI